MNEKRPRFEALAAPEREAKLAAFRDALNNVSVSSPEVLDVFADALENEMTTPDINESKETLRTVADKETIEDLRVEIRRAAMELRS